MRKFIKKAIAVTTAVSLAVGSFFTGTAPIVKADSIANTEATKDRYPWTPVEGGTTGDYIADSYDGVETGHVFESVTQERLLDILSSKGNYYIVFGGPEHATSQTVLATINKQAKADGITKIYHFDPYTDANTVFKGNRVSVNELWKRIVALLPESEAITNYNSSDTLLFAISNDGATKEIKASYDLKTTDDFDEAAAKSEIAKVFRGGAADGAVVAGDVRTDFEFFKRTYNAAATYIETLQGDEPTASRLGKATEIFTDDDKEGFALHQVNYNELVNLLQSKGEHYIFFGASWCHNTQAIIGQVARKAKANGKTVYVYDTTVGNQLTFGTGNEIDTVIGTSSAFNSRNNATTANGNNNISYLYGELVKYLGDFITENNSNQNNSITYFPNGDLTGTVTSAKPWEDAEEGTVKNAIRLQMPFLIGYDKDAEQPVTKQWLHKNVANNGTYTEYMLELAWVLGTPEAVAGGGNKDGLSYVEFAAEAVKELSTVLGEPEVVSGDNNETTTGDNNETTTSGNNETTTSGNSETTTAVPTTTTDTPDTVEAPAKAKIQKVAAKKKSAKKVKLTIKKIKANGYQVAIYKTKKNAKKNRKALVKKIVKKVKVTVSSKKLKNKKALFVRVRAYNLDGKTKVYGKWSAVKSVKIK